MKKVLSLVLVIAMVLSSMSFAFAAKFEDVADTDYAEAIDTLFALGVITGYEDGTYRPENTVTRAEMAKLMVELLGYGDLVAGSKSNFVDTQGHWADQWIALAAGRGIVIGTGDGKFNPDGIVTYDQVLTMLVRGLGYTDNSNEMKNMTWPTNFKVKAAELNITKNVDMRSANADRGGVAQAMFNSLDQQLVKVNSDGDIVKEYRVDGKDNQIPVRLISRIATPNYEFTVDFEHINPEDKNYAGDKVDLTPYLFQSIEAYFNKNKDKEVVYVGKVNSLVYTESFEDTFVLPGTSTKGELEVGDYSFAIKGSQVSYNNVEEKLNDLKVADLENSTITVVLHKDETRVKDDAEVAGIIVSKANSYVQIEEEYKDGETEIDEIYLPVKNKKVDEKNLIVKGDVETLEDIEKDDIVSVYAPLGKDATVKATDRLTLVVSRDTLEGKVTGLHADGVYVDKTKYDVNDALSISDFEVGDEGTFYLDDNGDIIAFKGESEGDTTYAVVKEMVSGRFEYNGTGSAQKATVIRAPKVTLYTASNETITYEFDVEIEKVGANWVIKNDKISGLFNLLPQSGSGDLVIGVKTPDLSKQLVSYALDSKSKEITKLEATGRSIDMKTNSKSFVLASNVVIFNADGDVISESKLGSEVQGTAVYKNGKIVALYATNTADKETYAFAYINSVYQDTDDDGDKVQRVNAYINGVKNENLFTAKKDTFSGFSNSTDISEKNNGLYIVGLNEDGVVQTNHGVYTTLLSEGSATTASAVNASTGKVETAAGDFYFDQNAGTIIKVKADGKVELVSKLKAIDGTKIQFFVNQVEDASGNPVDETVTAPALNTANFIVIWE
ncbi:S-layer homology domain-containing protein [Sedimentibacter hydroxybenzoicus DSM 7310]|uniref:S-layer homology domain-containing protein n=1 Tax=Sedimentibacter hydroxybenzoicus DSM 7310 TaxID=1123245 RepID=A0A974BLF1_SEDHY|nr:S-layer homology domain-containing protein [Sedimentibacter hydroxybenzoicus]NYB75394.1 S-layer homology domain-containing protein [Sedimentibacter hydroxybenzoicus DSM 7310]